ncbi:MAG: metalloregulator ArsR/SmtB family transcription factor [Dehalococcoidia bacterium]
MDDVLRALSDPTRREVVRLLARRGPMTAGELGDQFDLAKSTMSGHFNVLRQAGLIVAERQGTSIVYSASLSVAEEAMVALMGAFGLGRGPAPEGIASETASGADERPRGG